MLMIIPCPGCHSTKGMGLDNRCVDCGLYREPPVNWEARAKLAETQRDEADRTAKRLAELVLTDEAQTVVLRELLELAMPYLNLGSPPNEIQSFREERERRYALLKNILAQPSATTAALTEIVGLSRGLVDDQHPPDFYKVNEIIGKLRLVFAKFDGACR